MQTLLIVEDTPNLLAWLRGLVKRQFPHLTAVEATNAAEARTEVSNRQPDLVVLDLGLPENGGDTVPRPENGLGLLRLIKQTSPSTRVAVLTSHELEPECREGGADEFVPKSDPQVWARLTNCISAWAQV